MGSIPDVEHSVARFRKHKSPSAALKCRLPIFQERAHSEFPPELITMPTYEYKCRKCENVFDVFQSMKARKLTKCPDTECDGKVDRLLGTGAGLIFKGSGFYETDYRSDSYKKGAKEAESAAKPASEKSGDSSKSDTGSKPKETKPSKKPKAASSKD